MADKGGRWEENIGEWAAWTLACRRGWWETGKWTGYKVICDVLPTLMVKQLVMMMMMISMIIVDLK